MYYEEKLIDGAWYFRYSPTAAFEPMSTAMLVQKIANLSARLSTAENVVLKMREDLKKEIITFIESL